MMRCVRVTVTIDGDVLAAAKALASRRGSSLGSALSELARRGYSNLTPVRKGGDDTVWSCPGFVDSLCLGIQAASRWDFSKLTGDRYPIAE